MKELYSRFVSENKDLIHFAAHSHHYWADVTFQAVQDYWNDSAKLIDEKWSYLFSNKILDLGKIKLFGIKNLF